MITAELNSAIFRFEGYSANNKLDSRCVEWKLLSTNQNCIDDVVWKVPREKSAVKECL